jgi:hypothetical protein
MELAYTIYKAFCKLAFAVLILFLVKLAVRLLLVGNIFVVIPVLLICALWIYRAVLANLTFSNL